MSFRDFIIQGKVREGQPDLQKAKALVAMSRNNANTIPLIPLTDTSSSTILVIAYESLRELLEAMCLKQGLRVYSHEAFTFYLEELGETKIARGFDRLRKLRNGVNYYGKTVSIAVTSEAIEQVKELSKKLTKKYL